MRRSLQKLAGVGSLLVATVSHAAAAGMPWETSLDSLTNAITGPVAKAIGVIAIFGCGIGLAFGDAGTLTRKALWVVLGLTIAFNAASWGLTFFGFAGGLTV
jgi:type IV secretion system protein TrbC